MNNPGQKKCLISHRAPKVSYFKESASNVRRPHQAKTRLFWKPSNETSSPNQVIAGAAKHVRLPGEQEAQSCGHYQSPGRSLTQMKKLNGDVARPKGCSVNSDDCQKSSGCKIKTSITSKPLLTECANEKLEKDPWWLNYKSASLLGISMIMVSLQTSLVKHLTDLGDTDCKQPSTPAPGPENLAGVQTNGYITVFNLLAYGNIMVALVLITLFSGKLYKFKRLTWKHWLWCSFGAFLYSGLSCTFLYLALSETSQNNVVILTRFEPCLIMIFSFLILKEALPGYKIVGGAFVTLGIALMFLWPLIWGQSVKFGVGELFALFAMLCVAISSIVSILTLTDVPLGVFLCYRSFAGAILFLILGVLFNGGQSFVNPFLCTVNDTLIGAYAALTAGTQIIWFAAVQKSSGVQISFAISSGFPLLLFFAWLINGEVPSDAQLVGSACILCGLLYTNVMGIWDTGEETIEGRLTNSCTLSSQGPKISGDILLEPIKTRYGSHSWPSRGDSKNNACRKKRSQTFAGSSRANMSLGRFLFEELTPAHIQGYLDRSIIF